MRITLRPRAQRFVHRLFGLGIERCGGFVPDYPRCIAIHAAHYSHALPLSARKILAAAELARPQRLPAERQAFDDVDRTRVTRGAQQTFVVRIGEIVTSAADIIARCAAGGSAPAASYRHDRRVNPAPCHRDLYRPT